MATARQIIKQWFSNFKKPTQEHFWAWIDSFVHKDDKIPMDSVEGLENALQSVPTSDQFSNHLADEQAHKALFDSKLDKGTYTGNAKDLESAINHKVDKADGKGLSTNDFTNSDKQKLDNTADKVIVSGAVTGEVNKILTLTYSDGTALHISFQDLGIDNIADIMLNSLNFNFETGVLTGVRSDGQQLTVSLDGRYSLLEHTHQINDVTGLEDALNGKAEATHTHSYNDLTDKPTLFSGSYNDLSDKPTHTGIESIPFREIKLSVTSGQPFRIPILNTYELTHSIKIISNNPITGLSQTGLSGEGEKCVVIPYVWRKTSDSLSTVYYEVDLYTESTQVTIIYYVNNLEDYLNSFASRDYFFKSYKIDGVKVNQLLGRMITNTEGFTKLVIGEIPELYRWIPNVSGLQNKGFLSYIPEPYCRIGHTGRTGRNAKIIYADLSGQSFVLNRYFSGYQTGVNESHFVNTSFSTVWERYTEEQDSTENQKAKYEITSSSIQLTPDNSGTNFIYNNTSSLTIDVSSTTSLEDGLEWLIFFTGELQLNGQQNGGYGGGYGGYPTPIQFAVNTQVDCYNALQNSEVTKGDKIRIFVKNGAIYIVKD